MIIIVFGCVLLAWVDNVELIISPGREMLDEFYDEYTGRMDELSLEAYENIHKQVLRYGSVGRQGPRSGVEAESAAAMNFSCQELLRGASIL